MRLFRAMETSVSALTAERLRMDVIANNLANINTTRTAEGDPFRRRVVVQEERQGTFAGVLAAQGETQTTPGAGVRITEIAEDQSPYKLRHDPTHPDAGADGMVRLPNVDMLQEITEMMMAVRAYEANVTAFNAGKAMALKALEIGR